MKKLFISLLSVVSLVSFCIGFSACKTETELDKLAAQGYLLSVRYEAGAGKFLGVDDSYFLDMFKPSNYEKDASGNVSIKLTEPTDPVRKINDNSLTRTNYFYVGWYKNRTLVTNEKGEALDDKGVALIWNDQTEKYYYDGESKNPADPAYTYSDEWNFETDRMVMPADGKKHQETLYAGWVPYFTFTYYAKNDNGEWEPYATTNFDYKYNKSLIGDDGNPNGDLDVCYIPDWSDKDELTGEGVGHIAYSTKYKCEDTLFKFPQKDDALHFVAAYASRADADGKTNALTDEIRHNGSIDYANAKAIGGDQAIYVEYEKGAKYRITNAKQLADSANLDLDGVYEILYDLDFSAAGNGGTEVRWPALFASGDFSGEIKGNGKVLKNVTATVNAAKEYGGLFGNVKATAKIADLTFENVTVDISKVTTSKGRYGAFAGNVEKDATVSNVVMKNVTLRISGNMAINSEQQFFRMADGQKTGIAQEGGVKLVVYGNKSLVEGEYGYRFYFDENTYNEKNDGRIYVTMKYVRNDKNPQYEFQL